MKMNPLKKLSLFAFLLFLMSCASAGVKIAPERLTQMHKGETTYGDVVKAFGKPMQESMTSDGAKTIVYTYFSTQARPENFIPYVGLFVGGSDSENSTVVMNFDSDNILTGYSSSGGSLGVGTGFEAYAQPRNTNQPGKQ